jgi:hypothetical protein
MNKIFTLPLLVFLLLGFSASAQDGKLMFADMKLHSGSHIYTGQNLTDFLQYGYGALELRLGWQTDGSKEWHHDYNFPYFGVGWYTGTLGDPQVFGQPNALYGFFGWPVGKHKRNSFNPELALGLTYGLEPYNPDNNAVNDAIGARTAVYFNLNFGFNYALNREIDLIYGVDFTHFSNGRTFTPNYGLNMFGLNVGARYHFNTGQKRYSPGIRPEKVLGNRADYTKRKKVKKLLNENNVLATVGFGTTQNNEDAGTSNRYFNFSGILDFQHFFSVKHGMTAGLDFFHDGSLEPQGQETDMLGAHLGYDFRFWDLTIRLQLGSVFSGSEDRVGSVYMRPAIKYDVFDRLYAQVALKTINGAVADWIEFGFGYTIIHKRKERSR